MKGEQIQVKIDTPKWSFIKRKDDGSVDYISLLPCPFNYGSIPDSVGDDGDRKDALVLGRRAKRGTQFLVSSVGVVEFYDDSEYDPKEITLVGRRLTAWHKTTIWAFFHFFVLAKKVLNFAKRKKGRTYLGQIIYF